MRIVFFGSDDFAAVSLKGLLASTHGVVACVTQPDKPQGRGMKVVISLIKEIALAHQIPCVQPVTLKISEDVQPLKSFNADLFVVVAYGRLLTQEVLNIPKLFCINVHGSLLPKYRGAAPVNWAILNGEKQTGVTVQKMTLALDAGDIITQATMTIGGDEDAAQLRSRMAQEGATLLVRTLDSIKASTYQLSPQNPAEITFAPKLTKEMGKIDWHKSAEYIHHQIRGLQPWPGAHTSHKGNIIKIIQALPVTVEVTIPWAGHVMEISKLGIMVATGQGALLIKNVQPQGGKAMSAYDYVQGHPVKIGNYFN